MKLETPSRWREFLRGAAAGLCFCAVVCLLVGVGPWRVLVGLSLLAVAVAK